LGASFYADYTCTDNGLWTPIDGFVFLTNLIPVNAEQGTSSIQAGGSNVGLAGVSTNLGYANVLTDYNVSGYPEEQLQAIEYTPSAEYRIGNLLGHSAIQAVDVTIQWRYRLTGELFPLYLPANSSAGLKVLFRKKTWQTK
jgi:hypothetical protein